MRFQYRFSKSKPKRLRKPKRKVFFYLSQKDLYIAEFGKEIVKFYYKHIHKEKPPVFIPNKIDNQTQTNFFNLLCNTRKTAALIFVSALLFFLPIDLFSQYNNPKTITGTIENTQGKLWNNVLVELYENEQLIASDITENGEFVFENVITDVKTEEQPTGFRLYQNYPNPFNPSTIIRFVVETQHAVSLRVYDILGREVKTLISQQLSPGEHSVTWNGTNNNGQGVSAGVYFYRLVTDDFIQTKKMVLTDGASSSVQSSNLSAVVLTKADQSFKQSFNHLSTEGYYLRITGDSLLTTTISDLPIWQDQSFFDLGNLIAPGKPIVTGFVYDLDNKYDDENNNRISPIPGLAGKKVYFGSNPNEYVLTNTQGLFELIADTLKTDTIFVTNIEGDTTHYNWKRTFELQPDEQRITAFNDTTGIPMFKQWIDPENGVDFLEHLVYVGLINIRWQQYPDSWFQTIPRVSDQDLPIKVYLNRENAPNEWYADSAWSGVKAMEVGRVRFEETTDSNQAMIKFSYQNSFSGQTKLNEYIFDDYGPYLKKGMKIMIKGPPGGEVHEPELMTNVSAHEIMHILYAVGEHSPFIQDRFYSVSRERMLAGYPVNMSEREEKGVKLIYELERNPRILDYTKN